MALSIKSPETELLVKRLAEISGTSTDEAVHAAVAEKLDRANGLNSEQRKLVDDLMAIAKDCARLPILDPRSADEILGYDENGLPT